MDKTIRIGFLFPFDGTEIDSQGYNKGWYDYIVKPLKKYSKYSIDIVHPSKGCDILFYSIDTYKNNIDIPNIDKCIKVFVSFEHPQTLQPMLQFGAQYFITHAIDSNYNCYYPLWAISTKKLYEFYDKREEHSKDKFCTFISSNDWLQSDGVNFRIGLFDYISRNYKQVDGCGSVRNTIGYKLPLHYDNIELVVNFHKPYKFHMCCENWTSGGELQYCTEKLVNAYTFGCVPIYYGYKDVNKFFNPKSFINCNDKSYSEIKDEIEYYDNNQQAYNEMLNEYPFVCDIKWCDFFEQKLAIFIAKIIEENNL